MRTKMTENDFLKPVFSLNPIVVALLIWFWGFGSLALIAIKTNSFGGVLLRHPGFIIGDFFLLPLAGLLIAYFYQHVSAPQRWVTSKVWIFGGAGAATILTVVSVVRNDLIYIWFVPHGTFYWFMAYVLITFFPRGLLQLVASKAERGLWPVWLAALLAVSGHFVIPMIFGPKILPKP